MKKIITVVPVYQPYSSVTKTPIDVFKATIDSLLNQFLVESEVLCVGVNGEILSHEFLKDRPNLRILDLEDKKEDSYNYFVKKGLEEIKKFDFDYYSICDTNCISDIDRYFEQISSMELNNTKISICSKRKQFFRAGTWKLTEDNYNNSTYTKYFNQSDILTSLPKEMGTPIDSGVVFHKSINSKFHIKNDLPFVFYLEYISKISEKNPFLVIRDAFIKSFQDENLFFDNFDKDKCEKLRNKDMDYLKSKGIA